MSSFESDEYLRHVRATVRLAAAFVPSERLEEVHRLIEHGEPAEGLCSLAWAIVAEAASVPASVIDAILRYTEGLVDDGFMPPGLRDHAVPDAAGSVDL